MDDVNLRVIRDVKAIRMGVGGTGTDDYEVELTCGHEVIFNRKALADAGSHLLVMDCEACQDKFTKDILMYQVPRVK